MKKSSGFVLFALLVLAGCRTTLAAYDDAPFESGPRPTRYEVGSHVYLRRSGLATVTAYLPRVPFSASESSKGLEPKGYELQILGGAKVMISSDLAPKYVRPLMTRDDAQRVLDTLRSDGPSGEEFSERQLAIEVARVTEQGGPGAHAQLLRRLYAATPRRDVKDARAQLEDLVLAEIAFVLKVERGQLEQELRGRYPDFSPQTF